MKRPPNAKKVKAADFVDYARVPGVGLRKDVRLPTNRGDVYAKVDEIWEAAGKLYVRSGEELVAYPLSYVKSINYDVSEE